MKIYSKWKDEEVIKLFRYIENGKSKNVKLIKLFDEYANLTNRKPNSVRNYYYAELCNLIENEKRRTKLGIDVSLHSKVEQKSFSKEESDLLMKDIFNLTQKGVSVRKACLILAGNDLNKMVRLQNKYRSNLVKNDLKNKKNDKKQQNIGKIIAFPGKTTLSESDINSLFLGLVKLVKKQTMEEISLDYEKNLRDANGRLRETIVELAQKELEIRNLRNDFKILSQKNSILEEENKKLKSYKCEIENQSSKLNKLKDFTQRVNNKSKSKIS